MQDWWRAGFPNSDLILQSSIGPRTLFLCQLVMENNSKLKTCIAKKNQAVLTQTLMDCSGETL